VASQNQSIFHKIRRKNWEPRPLLLLDKKIFETTPIFDPMFWNVLPIPILASLEEKKINKQFS
jgi:hypothetical protein